LRVNRILIVDPAGDYTFLLDRARALGWDAALLTRRENLSLDAACHVVSRLDEESIKKHARDVGADALYPASSEVFSAVMAAALRLGLPAFNPQDNESLHHRVARSYASEQYAIAGTALVEEAQEARHAAEALGLPLWVKTAGADGHARCMRLDHLSDLPLAIVKVTKYARSHRVVLQKIVEGPSYLVLGVKTRQQFHELAVLAISHVAEPFRIPVIAGLPAPVSAREYELLLDAAGRAGELVASGHGLLEVELTWAGGRPVLTNLRCATQVDPVLASLLAHATGIDLYSEVLRCAMDGAPDRTARREIAAAACWLTARSGRVLELRGLAEARSCEGIVAVESSLCAGEVVGHVLDRESLNHLGYVIATAPDSATAFERARQACRAIDIVTQIVEE